MSSAVILASLCVPPALNAPQAAAAPTKLTVATGSITCRKLTGSITFTPPVRTHVDQNDTRVVSVHVSACTTKNSNVAHVSGGSLTVTLHGPVQGCSAEERGLLTGTERWHPSSIAPSTAAWEGYTDRGAGAAGLVYSNGGLDKVIVAPAPGNSVSVTGSFAGKASYAAQENLHGSIVAYTDQTDRQFRAECGSVAGIAEVNFVSGVETLP